MICGWCLRSGLKLVQDGRDSVLPKHFIPNTVSAECKGLETYLRRGYQPSKPVATQPESE